MKPTVFIHTNHKQIAGAIVATHALKRASMTPDAFDVKIIDVRDYSYFREFDGKHYLRGGVQRPWQFEDLQSFTPLRFMPPELMVYEGRAIVIDPDVFAVADIMELFQQDMGEHAVRLVHRVRKDGSQELMTSVMLMECSKLKHWNVEKTFRQMFDSEVDYADWLSLKLEDPATVGDLPKEWNHFDTLTPGTKMLHTTQRRTQPWKSGLPIDYKLDLESTYRLKFAALQEKIFGKQIFCKRYKPHPDVRQEQLFFALLKECLESGEISEEMLKGEMKKNHVRHDALKILQKVKPLPSPAQFSKFLAS